MVFLKKVVAFPHFVVVECSRAMTVDVFSITYFDSVKGNYHDQENKRC